MVNVTRVHLKTGGTKDRGALIEFCLKKSKQFIAIGWCYGFYDTFQDYYTGVQSTLKKQGKKTPSVLNVFRDTKRDDLFWTRDLDGIYWICRAKGVAEAYHDADLDIGALVPVEAYPVGTQVPGQIKAAFNRARGGTSQRIWDKLMIEYSKSVFNMACGETYYTVKKLEGNILDNLPDFDLEELVISYLQIMQDYYVLSNSIANKSTTIKIECELMSRNLESPEKAVVQVKGRKAAPLDARQFAEFEQEGYKVYLYAPTVVNMDSLSKGVQISDEDLLEFYHRYQRNSPQSITCWENLLD